MKMERWPWLGAFRIRNMHPGELTILSILYLLNGNHNFQHSMRKAFYTLPKLRRSDVGVTELEMASTAEPSFQGPTTNR